MVEPQQQRGVHCRFGMPGIIAESHFDSGRNFIFMTRGRKRYIMAPPEQCSTQHLLTKGPSERHSSLDWTNPLDIEKLRRANSRAIDIVLEPGQALYIPSFWFHFIVSLTVNAQCNARSGTPPHGTESIAECGFVSKVTEEVGESTSFAPPLPHLLAIASSGEDLRSTDTLTVAQLVGVAEAVSLANGDVAAPLMAPPPDLADRIRAIREREEQEDHPEMKSAQKKESHSAADALAAIFKSITGIHDEKPPVAVDHEADVINATVSLSRQGTPVHHDGNADGRGLKEDHGSYIPVLVAASVFVAALFIWRRWLLSCRGMSSPRRSPSGRAKSTV
jgi:hypothetical protein